MCVYGLKGSPTEEAEYTHTHQIHRIACLRKSYESYSLNHYIIKNVKCHPIKMSLFFYRAWSSLYNPNRALNTALMGGPLNPALVNRNIPYTGANPYSSGVYPGAGVYPRGGMYPQGANLPGPTNANSESYSGSYPYQYTGSISGTNPYVDPYNDMLFSQFTYHRWGFGVLLIITLLLGFFLNFAFLLSFVFNKSIRKLPNWTLFCLSIRDIIVALIMIPTAFNWLISNFGIWTGGRAWCKIAGFLDFTLTSMYPLLLLSFTLILYSRGYGPRIEDELEDIPVDEVDPLAGPNPGSILNTNGPSRAPSVVSSIRPSPQAPRAPSVDGFRHPSRVQRSPFYNTPNRPGSVTGSIEGRLAAGRMMNSTKRGFAARQTTPVSRPGSVQAANGMPAQNGSFIASSPLPEVAEQDLWEEASLDYPGRVLESPGSDRWDILIDDGQVRYHLWHYIILGLFASASLAFGIPGAFMIEHLYGMRPGCYVPVNPFENPHSSTIVDPGYNFMLAFVIICYLIFALLLMILTGLICFHRMADKRFQTFVKILACLIGIYILSRSPVDISQLKAIIEAGLGYNLRDPMEIEIEVVLIWATFVPLILNPVVYLAFLADYRSGVRKVWQKLTGRRRDRGSRYKEDEILAAKDSVESTRETKIL